MLRRKKRNISAAFFVIYLAFLLRSHRIDLLQ